MRVCDEWNDVYDIDGNDDSFFVGLWDIVLGIHLDQ